MNDITELTPDTAPDPDPSEPCLSATESGTVAASRQMIAVGDLIAHPGNVRTDLALTDEFLASIAAEGVRIPLLVTTAGDGTWRVIEGHRRLAAAVKAGLTELPCDIDGDRADDEAGQYLDMLLANSDTYRSNYTVVEEAAALFAATKQAPTGPGFARQPAAPRPRSRQPS